MFIPDPDLDFLPIPDHGIPDHGSRGQKSTGSGSATLLVVDVKVIKVE